MNEMETSFIDTRARAWHAQKEELRKGSGANAEYLARTEAEICQSDDAEARYNHETLAARLAASRTRTDSTFSAALFTGASNSTRDDVDARERNGTFWAEMKYGGEGRSDPLHALGYTPDSEVKWEQTRERTGLRLDERKALSLADDTSGGFLAPPEWVGEVIKTSILFSPVREVVKVRTTANKSVQAPKRTQTAAAVWVSDGAARSETQNPAYGGVEIPTHELTAEVYISFATLEDAGFDLEAELTNEFAEQFAVSEGSAVVSGNGVGKPFGFTDAGQGIAATNSGTSGSIAPPTGAKGDAIISLVHAVKSPYAARNARFALNRQTLGSVRKLADTQGRYLWEPSPALGMPSMIFGFPYTEFPDMPNEGASTTPIAFGDFQRGYCLADRISIAVVRDPFSRASSGQVKFLARRRVGGQVVLAEAIRLLKCI